MGVSIIAARNHKFPPELPAIGFHEISLQRPLRMPKMVHYNAPGAYIYQTIFPVNEQTRRATDGKPFEGVERRRNPGIAMDIPEGNEVNVFHELGKALTSSLQLDQVLRTIMEKINEILRPDNWSLLLLDEEKQELYFELAVGKASQALRDVRIKMGQGIAGWVAQHGETVVVPDTSKDMRFFSKVDEKTQTETQSIVAVPVRFRDTCLGVIELINCVGPGGF